MMVHIEGMGFYGCLLACELARWDVPFTWHNRETGYSAWRASTGSILPCPTAPALHQSAYATWLRWTDPNLAPWAKLMLRGDEPIVIAGSLWYNPNLPAMGGQRISGIALPGDSLALSRDRSLHFHVTRFVRETRAAFQAAMRYSVSGSPTHYVIAHGFGRRLDHVNWGWSAYADLDFHPDILQSSHPNTVPCIYLRTTNFRYFYALPHPSGTWRIGSASIAQAAPGLSLGDAGLDRHLASFQRAMDRHLGGLVTVVGEVWGLTEGWRPTPASNDTDLVRTTTSAQPGWYPPSIVLEFPSMAGDGVRLAPAVLASALQALELQP